MSHPHRNGRLSCAAHCATPSRGVTYRLEPRAHVRSTFAVGPWPAARAPALMSHDYVHCRPTTAGAFACNCHVFALRHQTGAHRSCRGLDASDRVHARARSRSGNNSTKNASAKFWLTLGHVCVVIASAGTHTHTQTYGVCGFVHSIISVQARISR